MIRQRLQAQHCSSMSKFCSKFCADSKWSLLTFLMVFTAHSFHGMFWGLICCCCCQVASVVSNSVQPHRRKPTRLPRPWDSPGKNTVVGCHFLLQCMKVKSESEVAQSCPTLSNPMDYSLPGSSVHGIFQARILSLDSLNLSSLAS